MSMPEPSADASSGPDRRPDRDLGAVIAAEAAQPRAKRPWASRTYWFIGVGLVAKLIVLVPGLSGLQIDVGATTDIILLCLSFFADLGALWGRNKAQGPITWRRGDPRAVPVGHDDGLRAPARPDRPEELPPDALGDPAGYWRAGRGPFHDS
jgi:hypothetical protein